MKEATIKISPDGSEIELEGKTFEGKGCVDFFSQIQKGLGKIIEEKKLPAYYAKPKQGIKI